VETLESFSSVPEGLEHPQGAKRFVGRLHQVFGHQTISRVDKRRLTVVHRTAIEDSMYPPEADYTKQPL
jgi:branched-chain amino acid transport system substrate-binding protein